MAFIEIDMFPWFTATQAERQAEYLRRERAWQEQRQKEQA